MSRKSNSEERIVINTKDGLAAATSGVDSYLGNPNTVTQMVRDFFVVVFSARSKFQEDGDGDAATRRINSACLEYGARFLGEDANYKPMPWNSIHRLGNFLRATVPDVGDFETPGEAYFHFLAAQALSAAIALENGEQSENDVKAGMNEVVDDAVSVLMGTKPGAQL